jgi:hypothetical protein
MVMPWRIYGASAIGKSHIDGGLPCQDAFGNASGGERLIAVVCDGAGSASNSEIGAKECADVICAFLATGAGDPAAACEQLVIEQAVEAARTQIDRRAIELAIPARELACTLVGVVLFCQGGCLFHIGDGMAVAELADGTSVISLPENGEYANETYFVTNEDWRTHLRITPFTGQIRCLALLSDGAMPFVINREKTGLFGPFIDPVRTYLSTVGESEGSNALQATLADERTWSITSDDKTLLLILPL